MSLAPSALGARLRACPAPVRGPPERSQVAAAGWQAGEVGPVFPLQVGDPPAFAADHGLCPWMSGVPGPRSAPFPGLRFVGFFLV